MPLRSQRLLTLSRPLNLGLTLAPLRRGGVDPCMLIGTDGVWRATRTPDGPVTTHLAIKGTVLAMRAWGPGAEWAVEHLPQLAGEDDDDASFTARHPGIERLRRRLRGLRVPKSLALVEALVPTILEQKVVGLEAKRSYASLVRNLGQRAPEPPPTDGPAPALMVPPHPRQLAATPYYVFHRFGIERRRAEAVRRACSYAARLEQAVVLPPQEVTRLLTALPGIGPWTAAEVSLVALGDADAVSVGDYHLPHQVAWALAGEARADDCRMLELLEPYRGHRGRLIRLIVAGGTRPPRRGPRMPLREIASI